MRTARSWQVPMTVLRGREDNGRWTEQDRLMALGLTAYEATVCSGCGLPASMAHGDDNVGRWEVDTELICHGCEAKESAQQNHSPNDKPMPGQKMVLVDAHAAD